MSIRHQVGTAIRQIREADSLKLSDVCETLATQGSSMSVNTLSKIERGQCGIDVDYLVAIAAALDVPPSVLLDECASAAYLKRMESDAVLRSLVGQIEAASLYVNKET